MKPHLSGEAREAWLDSEVRELLQRVGRDILVPRFDGRVAMDVSTKSGDEVVTDADLLAESAIAAALVELIPRSVVVGEEACERCPALMSTIQAEDLVWVVDPLDGSANFATGDPNWGMMVALVRRGRTDAGWIYLPVAGQMVSGLRGRDVLLDGAPVRIPDPPALGELRGALFTRFLPTGLKQSIESNCVWTRTEQIGCAAKHYVSVLTGSEHFGLYYRALPWDHSAGSLLLQECGGVARRFDGSPFVPGDNREGLLVAANSSTWRAVHAGLMPGIDLVCDV